MAVAEKDGNWYIVQSRPVIIDGKKKYKNKWIPISATSKEDAEEEERNFKKKQSQGIEIDPNLTVYGLSEMWMNQHVKSPVEPRAKSTVIFYQDKLDNHIIPVIGAKKIRKLTIGDLDNVLIVCAEKGCIDTTLRQVYATMSAMFSWAKRKKKIEDNLMEYVDKPVVSEREFTLLHKKDIPKLLKAILTPNKFENKYAKDQRYTYYNMILVELTTALRINELCGIREIDIDFKNKTLHVRQQVIKAGANPEFGPVKDRKNKKPDQIPLANPVLLALKDEIKAKKLKKEEAEKKGITWTEYDLVFTNNHGGPIDSRHLDMRLFKTALKDAGLPIMKFHNLRHSVLTMLANDHEDINIISNLGRHVDINFTRKNYLHTNVESQRSASRKLEKVVFVKPSAPKRSKKIVK